MSSIRHLANCELLIGPVATFTRDYASDRVHCRCKRIFIIEGLHPTTDNTIGPDSVAKMAAVVRTTMMRQARFMSTSSRLFSSTTQPLRPFRPAPLIPSSTQFITPRCSILSRTAPFSTSPQRNILPAGPQVIKGGVNDPAPVPKPNPLHGSYHWTFERLLSVALVPLTMAPFAAGSLNPMLDATFIFAIILHSHMGFQ
jgi:hypothetical protein